MARTLRNALRRAGLLLSLLIVAACERPAPPPKPVTSQDLEVRLVSLAPALTQMLVDLGKDDLLVGVAENDMAAPRKLPVVGTYTEVNTEALMQVRPTLVVTLAAKGEIPARLKDLAVARGFGVAAFPMPESIDDMARILMADESDLLSDFVVGVPPSEHKQRGLGRVLGAPLAAQRLRLKMLQQLAAIEEAAADQPRPKVLLVIGTSPVMASGPKTVLNDMLGRAGGYNAVADAKVGAPVLDREALIVAAPEVILLMLPGSPDLATTGKDPRLSELADLPIPAVRDKRIVLINDPLAVLPSTSIPRITARMAQVLHPDRAAAIQQALTVSWTAATTSMPAMTRPAPSPSATPTDPRGAAPTTQPHAGQ